MNFKDYLQRDIATFLNIKEYGEEVELDGVKLLAVVIKHTGKTKPENISQKHDEYYIHPQLHGIELIGEYTTIYFRSADYKRAVPKQSEFIRLDGVRYKVEESKTEYGITRLDCTTERMQQPRLPRVGM